MESLASPAIRRRIQSMEPRVTEEDLALLLLGEDGLVTLGAMLSLPADAADLIEDQGGEGGRLVPTRLA